MKLQKSSSTPTTISSTPRTPNPAVSTTTFLRRDIYDLENDSEAFHALMQLYDQWAIMEDRFHEANYDHEYQVAESFRTRVNETNAKMHEIYRASIGHVRQAPAKDEFHSASSGSEQDHDEQQGQMHQDDRHVSPEMMLKVKRE